jgi:hypothetical protein
MPPALEGFLARLRGNAATASIPEPQRVLRLLVKDVLIGPEKITIRHRIPVREPPPMSVFADCVLFRLPGGAQLPVTMLGIRSDAE